MGESKRRSVVLPADFDREAFARATRKVFEASSTALMRDCYTHAAITQAALRVLGITLDMRVGYAAWRVSDEPHGVVAHHPQSNTVDGLPGMVMYHAWLQGGVDIVDFTTYQLPAKAAALDAVDGMKTAVVWAPGYLWVPAVSGVSFEGVRDGYRPGLYHYRRDMGLESALRNNALPVENEDVDTLLMVYRLECSGGVVVVGPNHI